MFGKNHSISTMNDRFSGYRCRVEEQLRQALALPDCPSPLIDAMRYAVFNGGKRLRPVLVYLSCDLLETDPVLADVPAAAIELIHTYSLVHDDLPAMDDDDLRRGNPSCHIAFDEATAILAGDGLQTLAFEILAGDERSPPATRLSLIHDLARAAGPRGMVAGQMIDLVSENQPVSVQALNDMHGRKTGDLIAVALAFGGYLGNADPDTFSALQDFGTGLGLAFQIRDDILDVTGDENTLGKPVGSDAGNSKSTFVSHYGIEGASNRLDDLLAGMRECLAPLGSRARPLVELAEFVITREY